jgi:hypothetical protein
LTGQVGASGIEDLYDPQSLRADQKRYSERMEELFRVRIWSFFTPQEQEVLSKVRLQVPLIGESQNPFDFYRIGNNVVMPALSLKFVEDLSNAYAWLYAKRYRLEPIDEYVAMLRYKPIRDFPGSRYPPPLEALGIPKDGWRDPEVKELYLSLRNEAWAFILLHELGHVFHQTPGYSSVTPNQSQHNESLADNFALDVLKRSQTIPMGMVLWFQATAPWFPNRADYSNDDEFQKAVAASLTHPVNPERLSSIARHMRLWSDSGFDPSHTSIVSYISMRLEMIGEMLADPNMQLAVEALAQRNDLESLKPRR